MKEIALALVQRGVRDDGIPRCLLKSPHVLETFWTRSERVIASLKPACKSAQPQVARPLQRLVEGLIVVEWVGHSCSPRGSRCPCRRVCHE